LPTPLIYVDSGDPGDAERMGLDSPTDENHTRLYREAWGDFTLAAGGAQVEVAEHAMTHIARAVLDPDAYSRPALLRLTRAL